MAERARELGVSLAGAGHAPLRVGLLTIDEARNVRFVVDEAYVDLGPGRPILSAAWHVPGDDDRTVARLRAPGDKQARSGFLPVWFANLLPEGALRQLVEAGLRTGRVDDFDIVERLGGDLPGAVVVGEGGEGVPLEAPGPAAGKARAPRLRFSLAGVQLKFSSVRDGARLTIPARGRTGDLVVKLPSERFPDLPEVEYASMRLAAALGVDVAPVELLPASWAVDVPARLRPGPSVLAVRRFDRAGAGRVHVEDLAQVFGAVGDQKYQRANEETVVNAVRRLTTGGAAAGEAAVARIVANILIGNTDAHLKNWSLVYADPARPALAPAYDVVSVFLLNGDEEMALRLRGTRDGAIVTADRFAGFARFVGLREARMRDVVAGTVRRAAEAWPALLPELPLRRGQVARLAERWDRLALTRGFANPLARGPA